MLAGGTVEEPDPLFSAFPATKYRCSTLDGEPVEATEAVAHALIGHIRRVVIGSDSVVIDLGRERRLFTGAAALAVKLSQTTCSWPGCLVPVTQCQCDHVEPWTTTTRRPRRRVYLPRQRGVLLRETQPGEGTRLHRPPRPHRPLAHPPPRRHRDRMTAAPAEPRRETVVMDDGTTFTWRDQVSDDELVELVLSHGGQAVTGWWDRIRPHSLGWVTARTAEGTVLGFVNVAWDGGDHAFLLDTKTRGTHQHRGIGTELVGVAVRHAADAGCEWLHVDFRPGLGPFYLDACGFQTTAAGLVHLPTVE